MQFKQKEWDAEKARMDAIAREADKKHQQLADRTALVTSSPPLAHAILLGQVQRMLHANMVVITLAVLQELDKLQSSAKQDVARAQAQVRYPSVIKILDL